MALPTNRTAGGKIQAADINAIAAEVNAKADLAQVWTRAQTVPVVVVGVGEAAPAGTPDGALIIEITTV